VVALVTGSRGTKRRRAGYSVMFRKQIETAGRQLIRFDDQAHKFFDAYSGSPAVRALDPFSKLGDQPELRLIAASLIAAGTAAGSDRLVRAGARMIIAHEAATAAKNLLKTEIDRTRPRSASNLDEKKPSKGTKSAKEETSFPSGHSAGALAAARAFSREFPEYGPAAMAVAGLVAACQIVRCAHYPTDVVAGVAIGLTAEAVTNAAWTAARMDERSSE
jgi:membrane-associated phospholipid phosphatase